MFPISCEMSAAEWGRLGGGGGGRKLQIRPEMEKRIMALAHVAKET